MYFLALTLDGDWDDFGLSAQLSLCIPAHSIPPPTVHGHLCDCAMYSSNAEGRG